jgi:hypothetical protein
MLWTIAATLEAPVGFFFEGLVVAPIQRAA